MKKFLATLTDGTEHIIQAAKFEVEHAGSMVVHFFSDLEHRLVTHKVINGQLVATLGQASAAPTTVLTNVSSVTELKA